MSGNPPPLWPQQSLSPKLRFAETEYRKKCALKYPNKPPCPIHAAFGLPGPRTLRTWYVEFDESTKTMKRLSAEELQHNMECPIMIEYRKSIRELSKDPLRCAGCDEMFAYEHSVASHQICGDPHFVCPTCPGVQRRTLALLQDHFKQPNHKLRAIGWTLDGKLLDWNDVRSGKDGDSPPGDYVSAEGPYAFLPEYERPPPKQSASVLVPQRVAMAIPPDASKSASASLPSQPSQMLPNGNMASRSENGGTCVCRKQSA